VVVIERTSVSPKDLNRKRYDSQISYIAFKNSVKGLSLYGDLAPPNNLKRPDGSVGAGPSGVSVVKK
jgi:hypothetical protein